MSSIRLSPLSAPVSRGLRFLSLLCLALPLLAASAMAATAPAVATIARAQHGPVTTAGSLKWRVTFTEAVTGVNPADFALTSVDGAARGTLATVTTGSSAAEYFVTATDVAGTGTLRLDVKASGTGIVDGEGNALAGGFTRGQPYMHALGTAVVGWGRNDYGQLASSDTSDRLLPTSLPHFGALTGKTVVAVAGGLSHSLALCSDGTVAAWGDNTYGQLGDGSTTDSTTPVPVSMTGVLVGRTVVAVAAGESHSLALCSDGTVATWGQNYYGQLGDGSTSHRTAPVEVIKTGVLAGKTVVAVGAGGDSSLALCSDGRLVAWGKNASGQLGDGSTSNRLAPVAVSATGTSALTGKTVVELAAGSYHSLALCSDGAVVAWGNNSYGQFGDGSTSSSETPVAALRTGVLVGKTVVAVAVGGGHSLALCSDGTVAACGMNGDGQVGDGSTSDRSAPVAVNATGTSALTGKAVVALAAGPHYSLALCRGGTLAAWGYNTFGQLGDASTATRLAPVAVHASGVSALHNRTVYALGLGHSAFHNLALASPAAIAAVAPPTAGAYKAGAPLTFTLLTGGTVAVTGTPRLALTIGSATRYATYVSGSGSPSLIFSYTVQTGDTDAAGIAVASALELNGGTMIGSSGGAIELTLPAYTLPTITVDTTAPDTTIMALPANPSASGSATFTFSSLEVSASFEISLDGAVYAAATSPAILTGLADGSHTFSVRAIDEAGNVDATPASYTWTSDTMAPETTLTAQPANPSGSASATFTFVCDDGAGTGLARFEVSLDGAAYAAATSGVTYTDLTDGAHTFAVRSVDVVGNAEATPASYTWIIDTAAPSFPLLTSSAPAGTTTTSAHTLTGTAEVGATVKVYNAGLLVGTETADAEGHWSCALTLPDGATALTVTATDAAGNESPAAGVASWTIDTTPPAAPGIDALKTTTVSGTAEPGATVEVFLAGTSLGTTTADAAGRWSRTIAPLTTGTYSLTATATDAAGNSSAASIATTWTIDTTTPAVATIARTQPGPVTLERTLVWRVTFTEAVRGVDLTDFELEAVDGAATATLATVTPGASAAEYLVTATGVSGVGTLRLDVKDAGTGIVDLAGNDLADGFSLGQHYLPAYGTVPLAWGNNRDGDLGLGTDDDDPHPLPVVVPSTGALAGKTVVALAMGAHHTLALCSDGTVAAWGLNLHGQLGDGSTTYRQLVPVAVSTAPGSGLAGKKVVAIAAGYYHSVALCSDGKLAAWGDNTYGSVGDGTPYMRHIPVELRPDVSMPLYGKTVVAIAAGNYHSLALCSDGTALGWGQNKGYQVGLGQGSATTCYYPMPVKATPGTALHGKTVVAVAAGEDHSLALCRDGTVAAWGQNDDGQLGDGSLSVRNAPVAVRTAAGALMGRKVVAIAAGGEHSLALCADGTVAAWGKNYSGELGDGTDVSRKTPVVTAAGSGSALAGRTVVRLHGYSGALCSDGTVAMWGNNYQGGVGDGTTTGSVNIPTPINAVTGSALVGRVPYELGQEGAGCQRFLLASPTAIAAVGAPAAGTYRAGDTLTFTLTTAMPATVTGTPRLALTVGTETHHATYASGSGSTNLVFTYKVQAGDCDTDGLAVGPAVELAGGTITDPSGWSIALVLPAYSLPTILVDGLVPAAAITAFGGSHQIALPGTGFAAVLQAKVTDASGNPLSGRAVTFTAPGSGASASFAIATVDTDANGIARALATANGLSGAYQVTANVEPALAFPAVFQLENRTRLESWREAHFGSYDNSGDGADSAAPWGDGVANLLKYALDLDPTAPDASVMTVTGTKGLPLAGLDAAGRLTLTFVRRSVGTRPGITYTVQFSDDLVAWTSNPSATETATPIDAEFERVVVADSVAAGAVRRRFVRLLVTTP